VTYIDYKDEQKRYPKASAKFIRTWFEKHIPPTHALVAATSTAVDVDTEDVSEGASSEGSSPVHLAPSSSATSEDEEVKGFEKLDRTIVEEREDTIV